MENVEKTDLNDDLISELESEFYFPWKKEKSIAVEKAIHNYNVVYAEVLSDPEWEHKWEVGRRFDKESGYWMAKIKWYDHHFAFLDFGIELWLNDPYLDIFIEKEVDYFWRFVSENYDVVYNSYSFYIQKFAINWENFDIDYLEKNHFFEWCVFERATLPQDTPENYEVFALYASPSRWHWKCDFTWNNVVFFVYKPGDFHYYKISWMDGCAPDRCGVPDYIKIL